MSYGDKKNMDCCGRPAKEHELRMVGGRLRWICPGVATPQKK